MLRSNYFTLKKSVIVLSYINIFRVFLLLLPLCDSLSVVDRVHVPSQLQQHVRKRQGFDDYRVCASNFEIHQDKIIRTEESKRLGAKYLNGKDVTSKDECIKFCCDTLNCNVFVLEEKVFNQQIGTCYLFECGPPESFKCKFTRHLNYSSAVLIINRPQIQLEDEIQYSQHEHELTSLRKHGRTNSASDDVIPVMRDTKDMGKAVPDDNGVEETTYKKSGKCSPYQFECRTSGECIAIYNACDGIPQCADKSDEGVELACPTTPPIVPKKPEQIRANHVVTAYKETAVVPPVANMAEQNFLLHQQQQQQQQQQQLQQFLPQQQYNQQMNGNRWPLKTNQQPYYDGSPIRGDIPVMNENYQSAVNVNTIPKIPLQMASAANYGSREGELINSNSFTGPNSWSNKNEENHIFKQNYGALHNFNHKQNDATNIPFNEGEYSNLPANVPYDTYSNGYIVNNAYPSNANVWHRKYDQALSNSNTENTNISGKKLLPEYAYELVNGSVVRNEDRGRTANFSGKSPEIGKMSADEKTSNTPTSSVKNERIDKTTPTISNKQFVSSDTTVITTTGTTLARKEPEVTTKDDSNAVTSYDEKQKSHRKVENYVISSDVSVKTILLDDGQIHDGLTEQPSGAFISLILGICVTAIMVLVVGCRMKAVRKRIIRRGGKLPYAHDADFLVNGMYL